MYTFTSDMDETKLNNGHQPKQYKGSNDNGCCEVGNQDKYVGPVCVRVGIFYESE